MYTINYINLEDNFLRMKSESIKEIHFDTGVCYLASIKYLEFAEHVLVSGGRMIINQNDKIETPPDDYEPDKVGQVDLGKIQASREQDIQQSMPAALG